MSWLILVINVFHRGPYEPPPRSNRTQRGPIASGDGYVPVYLYKPIATCEFRGGEGEGSEPLLFLWDPPMGWAVIVSFPYHIILFFVLVLIVTGENMSSGFRTK